jgi:CBS domain-containing protein
VDVQDDVGKVARFMYQHEATHIPVLREGKLAGIVTRADLIRLLAQHQS